MLISTALSRTARFLCLRSAACCAALEHWSSKYLLPTLHLPCHNSSGCSFSVPLGVCMLLQKFSTMVPVIPLVSMHLLIQLERFPISDMSHKKNTITGILTSDPGIFLFPFFFVGKLYLVDSLLFTWSKMRLFSFEVAGVLHHQELCG